MATKIIWCLLAATALIHRGKVLTNFTFKLYFRRYGMFTRVYGVLKYYSRLLSKQMEGHIIAVQILLLLDYACISVGGIQEDTTCSSYKNRHNVKEFSYLIKCGICKNLQVHTCMRTLHTIHVLHYFIPV